MNSGGSKVIIRKRAELDMKNPPGQITLKDYYKAQGYTGPKKLTFDEWWTQQAFEGHAEPRFYAQMAWKAGQQNV
jgi:hypothetical protein